MNGEAFVCRMCGECCRGTGGIVVTYGETERISAALGLTPDEFLERFTVASGPKRLIASTQDGSCIFLHQSGCAIHGVKPDVCLAWPFFRGNLLDKESWAMAQDSCAGIVGEVGHEEFVRQGLAYLRVHGLLKGSDARQEQDPNALKVVDIDPMDNIGK
jgi:uncharacterized protein